MLTKKTNGVANGPRLSKVLGGLTGGTIDRRAFLKRSGLTAGGIAAAAALSPGMVTKAKAAAAPATGKISTVKSVCTHCAVGCTVVAEARSTRVPTARRAPRCASTPMASAACAIR